MNKQIILGVAFVGAIACFYCTSAKAGVYTLDQAGISTEYNTRTTSKTQRTIQTKDCDELVDSYGDPLASSQTGGRMNRYFIIPGKECWGDVYDPEGADSATP